jgi:uncharacterized metal-binding protein YceD (DUF177 family)
MEIRIDDIPAEGKDVSFSLDNDELNFRVAGLSHDSKVQHSAPPYVFAGETKTRLRLSRDGATISIKGWVSGTYTTPCARCAEDVSETLEIPIDIYLKPKRLDAAGVEDEDIGLGFYDGQKVVCREVVEELLILALPMVVRCKDDTVCALRGKEQTWVFGEESNEVGDERLKALRSLKLH